MQKKSMLKPLSLRKQVTLAEAKREEWPLPPQHLRVICLLSLTRKVIRNLTFKIKEHDEKQQEQMMIFNKFQTPYGKSFDYIAPVNKNIEQIKQTKEAYLNLKKQILSFLRQVKIGVQAQKSERLKKSQALPNFNLTSQEFGSTVLSMAMVKKTSRESEPNLNPSQICSIPPTRQIQPSESECPPSFTNLKSIINTSHKMNRIPTNDNTLNRSRYIINSKKLDKKIKNQSLVFEKFNKTLTTFCEVPDSKACLQLFQLYLRSLFEVKNCIAYSISILVHQRSQVKQRVFYLIRSLIHMSKDIYSLCIELAQFSRESRDKREEFAEIYKSLFQEKYNSKNQTGVEQQTEDAIEQFDGKQEEYIGKFIKKLSFMIQVAKMMITVSPSLSHPTVKDKQKDNLRQRLIANVLAKLSQFRYSVSYLNTEVQSLKRGKEHGGKSSGVGATRTKTKGEDENKENFQVRWRNIYMRKFGSTRNGDRLK